MKPWDENAAQRTVEAYPNHDPELARRVYSSQLLGGQPELVLHGGGNTSVKLKADDIFADTHDVLAVKGSGWDLARIEPAGFPHVRLHPLLKLRELAQLSDEEMVNQLRTQLLDVHAPNPSVEALLHAFIPAKFIDHTHADAILALANQADGAQRINDLYQGELGVVPYIMPGFALSKAAADIFDTDPQVKGLVLLNHGIFTFGASARVAYENMRDAVSKARLLLDKAATIFAVGAPETWPEDRARQLLTRVRGQINLYPKLPSPMVVIRRRSGILDRISLKNKWQALLTRGPITPDHVIRTKQKPCILELNSDDDSSWPEDIHNAMKSFTQDYQQYFERHAATASTPKTALDPLPRVILVPGLGILALGPDAKSAHVAADLFEHTLTTLVDAERIGQYAPLADQDIFDMEYWSLEQAKLGKRTPLPLSGKVAVITGAAGGIGRAIAQVFARQGCHLLLSDLDEKTLKQAQSDLDLGAMCQSVVADMCDPNGAETVLHAAIDHFGGVDIVISNAGAAFTGRIDENTALLNKSMQLNFWSHQYLAASASQWFVAQNTGGCLLFNASKSAFNPGPGFGPYAVPKAAVVALCKQYAVDMARFGIRANAINADRVRTGLFDDQLLRQRAAARGLDIDAYFRANMLGQEVFPKDVAQMFLDACLAVKTTGSVFQVDGGNIAASPR